MQGAFFGYIQTVCVAAKQRGRKIGTKLIERIDQRPELDYVVIGNAVAIKISVYV